ncbi:hypothetical protein [Pseudalkalibacillus decolorationis]|nr:hypothetical protein [Pseudalkalibacillus decolorationis]
MTNYRGAKDLTDNKISRGHIIKNYLRIKMVFGTFLL